MGGGGAEGRRATTPDPKSPTARSALKISAMERGMRRLAINCWRIWFGSTAPGESRPRAGCASP
jgi:hypothetical protein